MSVLSLAGLEEMTLADNVPVVAVVVGLALLGLGRRLYLLFVAAVGFLAGLWIVALLDMSAPTWLGLAVAILLGCGGALLALLAQRVAVAVAGFLLGGSLCYELMNVYAVSLEGAAWLLPLAAAILAAVLLLAVFDVALVVLTSILGAGLLVEASQVQGGAALLLFLVLLVVGIALQSRGLRAPRKQAKAA